jgi:ParB family chromosome partitioning protein
MPRTKQLLKSVSEASEPLSLSAGNVLVPLAGIHLRRGDDNARDLLAAHVVTLAESIAALGILEPVVVDLDGYLLAGGHRLAALQLLAEADGEARRKLFLDRRVAKAAEAGPEKAKIPLADRVAAIDTTAFLAKYPKAKVPVVAIDVSDKAGPALGFAIEAAENSIRKQYSRDEVQRLAAKLKKAGYTSRTGRPKTGEKSARPVLEVLVGCSGRNLRRLLGEEDAPAKSGWDLAVAALLRAAKRVQEEGKSKRSEENQRVVDLAAKVSKALASE